MCLWARARTDVRNSETHTQRKSLQHSVSIISTYLNRCSHHHRRGNPVRWAALCHPLTLVRHRRTHTDTHTSWQACRGTNTHSWQSYGSYEYIYHNVFIRKWQEKKKEKKGILAVCVCVCAQRTHSCCFDNISQLAACIKTGRKLTAWGVWVMLLLPLLAVCVCAWERQRERGRYCRIKKRK